MLQQNKTWKWIWVNAKQYRGILKRRLARFKWEQRRRKQSQKNKANKSNKNKSNKNKEESTIYSPTSTSLTWSSNLFVQELMKARARLKILEAKEQERDHKISEITLANRFLMEGNRILKEQVAMLQATLETGK